MANHPVSPVDISRVNIRTDLPVTERVRRFVEDVGDPYCFLVQGTIVHVRFRPNARSLQESLFHLASK